MSHAPHLVNAKATTKPCLPTHSNGLHKKTGRCTRPESSCFGAPGEIRTPDPQVRSLVLYPTELRARARSASMTMPTMIVKTNVWLARTPRRVRWCHCPLTMIAPGRSLAVSRATLAFGATAPSTDPAIGHAARQRRHKKADVQSAVLYLAEREGFEPSIQFDPYTPLAGEPLRPLGHLSMISPTLGPHEVNLMNLEASCVVMIYLSRS